MRLFMKKDTMQYVMMYSSTNEKHRLNCSDTYCMFLQSKGIVIFALVYTFSVM